MEFYVASDHPVVRRLVWLVTYIKYCRSIATGLADYGKDIVTSFICAYYVSIWLLSVQYVSQVESDIE